MTGTGQNALDRLSSLFSKLPGIGKKTASRLVYHVLDQSPSYALTLSAELANLHKAMRRCSRCGSFTETDPCHVCTDSGRDRFLLCIVERPQDVRIIDESREYRGIFHVLGGLIAPLEGIGPQEIDIERLPNRIREEGVREIILALNPTIEGDTTSLYIQRFLKERLGDSAPVITRLASGLPVGGDLEYADKLTLSRSFRGRVKI